MTDLTKPVVRKTLATVHSQGRQRAVVVKLEPHGMVLRLAKCRDEYVLPYAVAFWRAVALATPEKKRARKNK
jgi:hypothetical protein